MVTEVRRHLGATIVTVQRRCALIESARWLVVLIAALGRGQAKFFSRNKRTYSPLQDKILP